MENNDQGSDADEETQEEVYGEQDTSHTEVDNTEDLEDETKDDSVEEEENYVEDPAQEDVVYAEDGEEDDNEVEEQLEYQEEVGQYQGEPADSPPSDPDDEFQQDDQDVYEAQEEVTVEQEDYEAQEEITGVTQEYDEQGDKEEIAAEEIADEQEFGNQEEESEEVANGQDYNEEVVGEQEYVEQEEVLNSEDVPQQGEVAQQEATVEEQDEIIGDQDEEQDSVIDTPAMEDAAASDDNPVEDPESLNKGDSEEEDFDNVVEVEEHKAESDEEDENVAQHDDVSDSENEDTVKGEEVKLGDVSEDDLRGASSGSENEASEDDNNVSPIKKRSAALSSDDEDDLGKEAKSSADNNDAALKLFDTDSEDEQKEDGVGDLIADIFGESDDEEEFTGFGQEEISNKKSSKAKTLGISEDDESDVETPPQVDDKESEDEDLSAKKASKKKTVAEESDSDEGVQDSRGAAMSDFELMMQRKKENGRRRRRKDGGTFISDADDIINAMLTKMKEAAESDRASNQNRKPALSKLKMLPAVVAHLKKQDLKEAFVDNGVIAAIADWLSLLPDRSLPHITIRTELLKILHDLPPVGAGTLKQSGIGKSVMILFKHPREIRPNKDSAGRLINKWSRPIFGLNENFKSMSREEREQRDLEQMPQAKRRRLSSGAAKGQMEEGRGEGELGHLRPGEQGFVMRARVPMPSTKDYVVRPRWNVEAGGGMDDDEEAPSRVQKRRRSGGAPRSSKKDERLEKHMKNFAERKKHSKIQRAVNISIEGNKMSIL